MQQFSVRQKDYTTLCTNLFFPKPKSYVGDLLRQNTVILQLLFLCKVHLKLNLRFLMQRFLSMGTITVGKSGKTPSQVMVHVSRARRFRFSGCYLLLSLHFFARKKVHILIFLSHSDTVSFKH